MRPEAGNKCHVSFVLTGIVRGSSSRASLVIVMREAQYVMQHALYVCVWLCICVCVCLRNGGIAVQKKDKTKKVAQLHCSR